MSQQEIDDISSTFEEAWKETFGMEVTYLQLIGTPRSDSPLYDEKIGKDEDFAPFGPLYATFKQQPTVEELADAGLRERVRGMFTFVVKSMVEQGITEVSVNDRIRSMDRFGKETTYAIKEFNNRVQFVNNYIFLKVGVDEL